MSEDVRRVVLQLIEQRTVFTVADVARALGQPATSGSIARAVRRLAEDGVLSRLGYRRQLRQQRTGQGVLTQVAYGPARSGRRTPAPVTSTAPTRTPAARPLGIGSGSGRRLEAQLSSLDERVRQAGAAVIRAGEHLLAIESLVGPPLARRRAAEVLGLSETTYRRWTTIARAFAGRTEAVLLAATRPSVLAALAAPSCPPQLREEALSRGGLRIAGRMVPLPQLRRRDVADAVRLRGARR